MNTIIMMLQLGCAKHGVKSAEVPTAEALFDAYQQAAVSAEYRDVDLLNIHTVGIVEMALMPQPFSVDSWIIHDKGSQTTIDIPGLGRVVEAYNLQYAWTLDPNSGDRLLDGEDLEYAKGEFRRAFVQNYSELYTDAVVAGAEVFEDQNVWKVTAKDALNGSKATLFFTQEESLLVGEYRSVEKNKGSMKMKLSFGDYQWVDGYNMPMKMTIKTMGIKQNFTLTEVTINNAETPDIVVPASILELMGEEGVSETLTTQGDSTQTPESAESTDDGDGDDASSIEEGTTSVPVEAEQAQDAPDTAE